MLYFNIVEFVGSRIVLSTILSIPSSNCTQEHKYFREKPFLLKGKNYGTNFESISLFSNQLQYFLCISHG